MIFPSPSEIYLFFIFILFSLQTCFFKHFRLNPHVPLIEWYSLLEYFLVPPFDLDLLIVAKNIYINNIIYIRRVQFHTLAQLFY